MRLCLTCEERFFRTPDGSFWSAGPSSYSFTRRYLGPFEEVRVIARAEDVREPRKGWSRADGEGVKFGPIPYYLGPVQYLKRVRSITKAVRTSLGPRDALVMRVGSQIASIMTAVLQGGRPYALEVIGDPLNVFARGSTEHPLRPFWRWWFTRLQRYQCAHATAVCYVTGDYLQRLYPCSHSAFSTSFLNMELDASSFIDAPRRFNNLPKPIRLITIGGLDQPYKGIDLLIRAVRQCVLRGWDLELAIVGGGRYRAQLEQEADRAGIARRVLFLGAIGAGPPVREQLDRSQLFVLFSKTEGLPRAMIEAMGRGLPCIGSAVGGIPELLAPPYLVPRGDSAALANKIVALLADPSHLNEASAGNLERARQYTDLLLDAKRAEFLDYLRRRTESWLAQCNLKSVGRS